METPLVTIVIPVFNSEKYIAETLDSVKNQIYENWECLLIDDGSCDKSIEIMHNYASQDKRFKVFKRNRKPKGVSVCRNIGIDHAKGTYLIFLDSDDLLRMHCLNERVKVMLQKPGLDFSVFQMQAFGLKRFKLTRRCNNYLLAFLKFTFPWQTSCPIWNLSFLRTIGYFNENLQMLEDPELHIRSLLATDKYLVLYDALPDSDYRVNRPYSFKKNRFYQKKLTNYGIFFENEDLIKNLSKKQKKCLRGGIYDLILTLIPPLQETEFEASEILVNSAKKHKIANLFQIIMSILALKLCRKSYLSNSRLILFAWAFLISPSRFYNELIVPKLEKATRISIKKQKI